MENSKSISGNELLSETIDFLRFPLVVGVVLIHSDPSIDVVAEGVKSGSEIDYLLYSRLVFLFSRIIAHLAVPLFFFFSGFLFF
jgi:peptidoglycan/LPS O-acetylase OafA/YrhL